MERLVSLQTVMVVLNKKTTTEPRRLQWTPLNPQAPRLTNATITIMWQSVQVSDYPVFSPNDQIF